jgi:hypothetical protein
LTSWSSGQAQAGTDMPVAQVCLPAHTDRDVGSTSVFDWYLNDVYLGRQTLWITRHWTSGCMVDFIRGDQQVCRAGGASMVTIDWTRAGTVGNTVIGGLPSRNETNVSGTTCVGTATNWQVWQLNQAIGFGLYASGRRFSTNSWTVRRQLLGVVWIPAAGHGRSQTVPSGNSYA